MKSVIILVLGSFLFAIGLHAQTLQISEQEIKTVANSYLKGCHPTDQCEVKEIVSLQDQSGNNILYEAITDNGRGVLFSGHKGCYPILADYCLSQNSSLLREFNSNTIPCNIKEFIDCYIEQLNDAFKSNDEKQYFSDEWNGLATGDSNLFARFYSVGDSLILTRWGQSSPYNYYTPSVNGCDHALVGCVAVAMGQVMNYWKYPVLVWSQRSQFNWCDMAESLDSHSPRFTEERDAVAFLLSICADSVDMDYGCNSSGAYMSNARDALVNKFYFSQDAELRRKLFYSDQAWIDMLKNNIDNGYPIIYAANRYESFFNWPGHAFVCDGYSGNRFHINWGWYGRYNGFYRLDYLQPKPDTCYRFNHEAIVDIHPRSTADFCNVSLSLEAFYGIYFANNGMITELPYNITPQTMTSLTSASPASPAAWRTIPAGATATYQAHEEIVLQDGFTVEAGAEFTAEIVPCPNCESSRGGTGSADGTEGEEYREITVPASRAAEQTQQPVADLYPNPTSGEVTVGVEGEVQSIVILNVMGQPVGGWGLRAMSPGSVTLDVSPLPAGTYLVRIHTPLGTATKKLLVGTE